MRSSLAATRPRTSSTTAGSRSGGVPAARRVVLARASVAAPEARNVRRDEVEGEDIPRSEPTGPRQAKANRPREGGSLLQRRNRVNRLTTLDAIPIGPKLVVVGYRPAEYLA